MSSSIRIVTFVLVLVFVLSLTGCTGGTSDYEAPPPPPTRVDTVVDTIHGVEIPDDYRWLEDQDSPETRSWIEAQNAYTSSALADRPESRLVRPSTEAHLTDVYGCGVAALRLQSGGKRVDLVPGCDAGRDHPSLHQFQESGQRILDALTLDHRLGPDSFETQPGLDERGGQAEPHRCVGTLRDKHFP